MQGWQRALGVHLIVVCIWGYGGGEMASQSNFVVTNMDTQMFWGVGLCNVGVNFRESHRG